MCWCSYPVSWTPPSSTRRISGVSVARGDLVSTMSHLRRHAGSDRAASRYAPTHPCRPILCLGSWGSPCLSVRDRFLSGSSERGGTSPVPMESNIIERDRSKGGPRSGPTASPVRWARRMRCRETLCDLWSSSWSGRPDLNRRPPVPQTGALPNCATSRRRQVRRRVLRSHARGGCWGGEWLGSWDAADDNRFVVAEDSPDLPGKREGVVAYLDDPQPSIRFVTSVESRKLMCVSSVAYPASWGTMTMT